MANNMALSLSLTNIDFDVEALSGICGSVSIACWIVVFSPQILQNFRRRSADGLSVSFIVIWLVGDVFNIVGAVFQRVLPTMIILAVYYTLADVVLLCQVWYYRGFTLRDEAVGSDDGGLVARHKGDDGEGQPLLTESRHQQLGGGTFDRDSRRSSCSSTTTQRLIATTDDTTTSPATPFVDDQSSDSSSTLLTDKSQSRRRQLQKGLFNFAAIILVCAAGVLGWWLSNVSSSQHTDYEKKMDLPQFDVLGQVFGYLCAVLYLGSRVPQLLLNYRRKSTEGVSLLFFMFACIGNLTYDMSIFAFNPAPYCQNGPQHCMAGESGAIYGRYIAVNASWIVGSLGTLLLDMAIFVQFFIYSQAEKPA